MLKKFYAWLAKIGYAWQMREIERYLSQAKDHAELEQLMNNLRYKHKL